GGRSRSTVTVQCPGFLAWQQAVESRSRMWTPTVGHRLLLSTSPPVGSQRRLLFPQWPPTDGSLRSCSTSRRTPSRSEYGISLRPLPIMRSARGKQSRKREVEPCTRHAKLLAVGTNPSRYRSSSQPVNLGPSCAGHAAPRSRTLPTLNLRK